MKRTAWLPSMLVLSAVAANAGCAVPTVSSPARSDKARQSSDVRAALLASAKKSDPDFPDGENTLLTHFSHVGQVVSSGGEVIHIADRRAVIAGMPAPRGQNHITFFDGQYRYLGKVGYVESRPLWCEGSRLYLFGDLDGFATGLSGNVIDLAGGYERLTACHASAYGSSGGIDD